MVKEERETEGGTETPRATTATSSSQPVEAASASAWGGSAAVGGLGLGVVLGEEREWRNRVLQMRGRVRRREDDNSVVVGGYFTDEGGIVKCWMGEKIHGRPQGDAYVQGLELTAQFMLETLNIGNKEIVIISDRKDIVEWLHGKQNTEWESRFLRNKTFNLRQVFKVEAFRIFVDTDEVKENL
ncbi:hypothetical protein PIB30_054629 [Stylosanthes scabra]|uniref:RNase H type-1 domain-containing protein n=1 Tax=Stylosanthes scabra TaxID=79078 RepID=A0ABU6UKV5_9FABA|nr:hypothetical protein [Stylosanthes scabra]